MCLSVVYEKRVFMVEDALRKYEGAVEPNTNGEMGIEATNLSVFPHISTLLVMHKHTHTPFHSPSWTNTDILPEPFLGFRSKTGTESMTWTPNVTALNIPLCVGLGSSDGAAASFP